MKNLWMILLSLTISLNAFSGDLIGIGGGGGNRLMAPNFVSGFNGNSVNLFTEGLPQNFPRAISTVPAARLIENNNTSSTVDISAINRVFENREAYKTINIHNYKEYLRNNLDLADSPINLGGDNTGGGYLIP